MWYLTPHHYTYLSNPTPTDADRTYSDVWSHNFHSVFNYTQHANTGIQGRVTDYEGNPVLGKLTKPSELSFDAVTLAKYKNSCISPQC